MKLSPSTNVPLGHNRLMRIGAVVRLSDSAYIILPIGAVCSITILSISLIYCNIERYSVIYVRLSLLCMSDCLFASSNLTIDSMGRVTKSLLVIPHSINYQYVSILIYTDIYVDIYMCNAVGSYI